MYLFAQRLAVRIGGGLGCVQLADVLQAVAQRHFDIHVALFDHCFTMLVNHGDSLQWLFPNLDPKAFLQECQELVLGVETV